MKNILILFFILSSDYSCRAQIVEEFKGCWLPEKYVFAKMANDTNNTDCFLYPVEGFEISKERTVEFIHYLELENQIVDVDKTILVKTYKSELNSILSEKFIYKTKEKYRLPFFFSYLNMKYIPQEIVERFEKANIYLSKAGNKLLLEIIENDKQEKIYFINGINDHIFKDVEEANQYLRTNFQLFPSRK
jgi:hypothetical protein